LVNDSMPPAREAPHLRDPLGHGLVSSAAPAAIPIGAPVAKPRRERQVGKWRRAHSFIGGCLIGVATALPVFALDAVEGNGALALLGSVTLAAAGIGIHLRGSH
jgi:hypothetical protein